MTNWDEEFDLVSVGSGAGGLAAAIAAGDSGLRAVVLEKTPRVGGNTVWSYGIVWVGNNDFARDQGIDDSFDQARAYLDYLSSNMRRVLSGISRQMRTFPSIWFGNCRTTIIHLARVHCPRDAACRCSRSSHRAWASLGAIGSKSIHMVTDA